jgi:hypothetical protein
MVVGEVGEVEAVFDVIILSELNNWWAWSYTFRALFDQKLHLFQGVYTSRFSIKDARNSNNPTGSSDTVAWNLQPISAGV